MPISADHALRRGMISAKAHAKIGVKHPRTGPDYRMTKFEHKGRDEGAGVHGISQTGKSSINRPNQTEGTPAHAGGKPRHGSPQASAPTRSAINERTGKHWPAGGGNTVKKGKKGFPGPRGTDTNGPAGIKGNYYGSTETNKYG